MKRIISLIIISIIIKGYINECTNNEGICTGGTEGETKCVYEEEGGVGQCVEKTLYDQVTVDLETNCEKAITLNPTVTKCVYESGKSKCVNKEICLLTAPSSEDDCNINTLTPELTKCVYVEGEVIA